MPAWSPEAFEAIRRDILCQRRDRARLREEVLAMRRKMHENLGTRGASELFDLKHDFGGLVDVEFIVQYLVLGYACDYPQLTGNLGNIALLKIAADCGLIPAELAEAAREAYREYRRLQHKLRLNNLDSRVEAAPLAARIAAVRALWKHVFGDS
jgi:glutamate-ammonia-ligase adenylyltransferase